MVTRSWRPGYCFGAASLEVEGGGADALAVALAVLRFCGRGSAAGGAGGLVSLIVFRWPRARSGGPLRAWPELRVAARVVGKPAADRRSVTQPVTGNSRRSKSTRRSSRPCTGRGPLSIERVVWASPASYAYVARPPRRQAGLEEKRREGRRSGPPDPFSQSGLALGDDRSRCLALADKAATQAQACNHQSQRQCDLLHEVPQFFADPVWTPKAHNIHIAETGASVEKAHAT